MVGFDPLANTGLGLRKKPIVGGQKSDIGKFSPDPQFASVATEQPKASFVAPTKPTVPTPASNSMITKVDVPQAPLTTPQMQSTTIAPTVPVEQPKQATFARPADAQNQAKDSTINLFLSQFANDIKAGMPREVIPQYYSELPVEVLADLYEDVKMGTKIEQLKPLYPELQNLNPLENIPVAMTTDDINPFGYVEKGANYLTQQAENINIPIIEPVVQGITSTASFASKGLKDLSTAGSSLTDTAMGGNLYNRSVAEDVFDVAQGTWNTALAVYAPRVTTAFNTAMQSVPQEGQQKIGEVFSDVGSFIGKIPGIKEVKESLPADRQQEFEQEVVGAMAGLIVGAKNKANIYKNPVKFFSENLNPATLAKNAQENVLNIPIRKAGQAIKGSAPTMQGAIQQGVEQAGKIAEGAKQMAGDLKEATTGIMDKTTDYIAKKATQTVSDEDKLFKASSPRFNVLNRNKDIKSMKENSRIADEAVVNEGYKPTDTESRVQAHKNTMEAQWKRIEAKIQNKEDYMADLTPVINDLEQYIAEVEKSGIAKNEGDINQLKKEVKRMKAEPRVDIPTLENKKQFINGVINNRGDSKIGDVYKNGMKKATARIGDIMDEIISTLPGELKNDKRIFGALKATYDDIIKANIKAQRKKGDGIVETFSRIEGFADIIGGGINLFSKGSQGIGQIAKGAGKVILGKSLAKATDPDFLIAEGFQGLAKKKPKPESRVEVEPKKPSNKYNTYTKTGLEQSKKSLDNRMLALPEKTTNNIGTPKNPIKAGYTPAKPTNKGLQAKSKQETATILSSKDFDKKGMTKITAIGYGDQAPKVGDFTSKGKIVETTHSGGGSPQRRVKVEGDTNWTKASDIEIYRKQGLVTKETPKIAQKQGGMVEKTAKVDDKGLEPKKVPAGELAPRDMPQEAMPIKNKLQEIKNAKGWTPRKEMLNSIQSEYGFKVDDLSIEDTDKLAKALNGNTSADKAMEIIEEIGGKYGKKFMKETNREYSGNELLDMLSKEGISITPSIKKYIKNQKYALKDVRISDILDNDPDAREFVEKSKIKGATNNKPIVIGTRYNKKNQVMDGYHRLAKAYNNGDTHIKSYVSLDDTKFMKETNTLYDEARKYKSAEEFVKGLEKDGKIMYHGTGKEKFTKFKITTKDIFDNSGIERPIFLTPSKEIARMPYAGGNDSRVMAVIDKSSNPFDFDRLFGEGKYFEDQIANTKLGKELISDLESGKLFSKATDGGDNISDVLKDISNGEPTAIEQSEFIKRMKNKGYDSFYTREHGVKNKGVFNTNDLDIIEPSKIREEANTKFSKETKKPKEGLSQAEISKTVAKYFKPDEVSVVFREKITTPDGSNAFGAYHNKMIEFAKNPMKGTPEHEVVHAYIDLFKTNQQKLDILDHVLETRKLEVGATKKKYGITDDYLGAEEFLADGFIKYAQGKATFTGKLKTYFQDLWNDIKSVFGKEDKVRRLYQDITGKKRPEGLEPKGTTKKFMQEDKMQDLYTEARKYKSAEEFIEGERKRHSFNLDDSEIQRTIKNKYPNVDILITENATEINLPKIIVPKEIRGSGIGTKIMKEIVNYSNKTGKRVVLTPSSDFGGSVVRLKEFYKRFGFLENKGKTKDYSTREGFIYTPKSDYKTQLRKIREEANKGLPEKKFMKDTSDEVKELVVIHNLTPEKLKKVVDLGGMPAPSIAITQKAIPFENYGDITLVSNKNLIDPRNKNVIVGKTDIYTPTVPTPEYILKKDSYTKQRIKEISKETGVSEWNIKEYFEDRHGNKNWLGNENPQLKKYDSEQLLLTDKKIFKGLNINANRMYKDYTIDNIVKDMFPKGGNATTAWGGGILAGSFNGAMANRTPLLKSIQDIKKVGFTAETPEMDAKYEKLESTYSEKLRNMIGDEKYWDLSKVFTEYIKKSNSYIASELKKYGAENVSEAKIQELKDILDEGLKLPKSYIEAKIKRGVYLNEFQYVLAPEGEIDSIKNILKDTPLKDKVVGYKPSEGRAKKLQELQDKYGNVFFSLGGVLFPFAYLIGQQENDK